MRSVLSPKAAYALWAPSYPPTAHNPLMRAEQSIVETLLARVRATRALDVGTGSGRCRPLLAASGATTIVGVDFSWAMLTRQGSGGVRVCGDACALPFRRGAFDLINASLMVSDVTDLGAWASELSRVLAPRGHLVYSDFHPSWTEHGWRRTFATTDGTAVDVEMVPHSIDDHLAAIEAAGLRVLAIREPKLAADDPDPAVKTFLRRWGRAPVVAVFHAVKDGR